jgi:hypothetical protein
VKSPANITNTTQKSLKTTYTPKSITQKLPKSGFPPNQTQILHRAASSSTNERLTLPVSTTRNQFLSILNLPRQVKVAMPLKIPEKERKSNQVRTLGSSALIAHPLPIDRAQKGMILRDRTAVPA